MPKIKHIFLIPLFAVLPVFSQDHSITYYLYFGTFIPGQGVGPVLRITPLGEEVNEGEVFTIPDYDLEQYNLDDTFLAYMAGMSGTTVLVEEGALNEDIEVHLILQNLIVVGGVGGQPLELVGIASPDEELQDQLWMFADFQVWSTDADSVQLNADEDYDFEGDARMIVNFPLDEEFLGMLAALRIEYRRLGAAIWLGRLGQWDFLGVERGMFPRGNPPRFQVGLDHLSELGGGPEGGFGDRYEIQLVEGWQIISSPSAPPRDRDYIVEVWQEVVERGNLILVKNQDGRFYVPDFGFEPMFDWDVRYGYQVKMSAEDVLTIYHEPEPEDTPIPLRQGWSMVSYFPEAELDARVALAGIVDVLMIVKDERGFFYHPGFGFNNMPPLRRGKGYQIKVSEETVLVWTIPDRR